MKKTKQVQLNGPIDYRYNKHTISMVMYFIIGYRYNKHTISMVMYFIIE